MLNKFITYYQKNNLLIESDKILLTVSGGKDSMAMLHLFKQHNLFFGIAHCNFQLRGKDADLDAKFVQDFAKTNNIPIHTITFDTQQYASEKGISIQMAARDLRYKWFDKIKGENNYQFIATAHHKNDVAETMLINLVNGTGLAGLHGIQNKNGNVIRPMLCFSSAEIENYVKENNISFREDGSNSDTKYTRNAIRHKIIPELEKINPALIDILNSEANYFFCDEKIISDKILSEKSRLFRGDGNGYKIAIEELIKLDPLSSYLYYFLREYGFNSSDVADIIEGLNAQSGQKYFSKSHQIIKDRSFLLLKKNETRLTEEIEIKSIKDFPFYNEVKDVTEDLTLIKSTRYAYFDLEKIQFPLLLRKWKAGDSFQPFGMAGNKKVSDFLIDNKVSFFDKESVNVLESNGQILWVVGQRIDDKYKITSSTKIVLILIVNE